MVDVAVRVTGLDDLRRELRRLSTDGAWAKELGKAGFKSGQVISTEMQHTAPRGPTGNLSASPRALKAANRAQIAIGSARVPYAGPINFGWRDRNISPQEFIYTSVVSKEDEFLEIYWDAINDVASRAFPIGNL